MRNVASVHTLLNAPVDEIWWDERLSPYNHNPHFPYFVTHYTDSMPICSMGGSLSDALFNPKYASHVYKVTLAMDNLGNIGWICNLMPGTLADVTIWDQRGPSRVHRRFFEYPPPPLSFPTPCPSPRGGGGPSLAQPRIFRCTSLCCCGKTTTQECCPKHSSGKW